MKSKLLARRAISFRFVIGGGMDSRSDEEKYIDDTPDKVFGRRCSIRHTLEIENTWA
jgi:hypothetical protein